MLRRFTNSYEKVVKERRCEKIIEAKIGHLEYAYVILTNLL